MFRAPSQNRVIGQLEPELFVKRMHERRIYEGQGRCQYLELAPVLEEESRKR
jgi:hypothetical protein